MGIQCRKDAIAVPRQIENGAIHAGTTTTEVSEDRSKIRVRPGAGQPAHVACVVSLAKWLLGDGPPMSQVRRRPSRRGRGALKTL